MIVSVNEYEKRLLGPTKEVFNSLKALYPATILSQDRLRFVNLPMEFLHTDMLVAEEEYRRLIFLNQEEVFGSNVPSEPIPFWLRLSSYSRQGDKPYEHLAAYALNCLLLPSSTASV